MTARRRSSFSTRLSLVLVAAGCAALVHAPSAHAAVTAPAPSAVAPPQQPHAAMIEKASQAAPTQAPHVQTVMPAQNPTAPAWAKDLAIRVPSLDRPTWSARFHGDPETMGTSAGMYSFRTDSSTYVRAHIDTWLPLAKKLMVSPDAAASLKPGVTPEDAQHFVDGMAKANIGTTIPEDGCYARADITAMAIRRAGFQVQKVNVVAPRGGAPLKADSVNTPTGSITWGYHVAPAVTVNGTTMVIDASLFDHPVTVDEWKGAMHQPDAKVIVTPADQLSYGLNVLTGDARVRQFAGNLGLAESIRRGYEPIRAHALVIPKS